MSDNEEELSPLEKSVLMANEPSKWVLRWRRAQMAMWYWPAAYSAGMIVVLIVYIPIIMAIWGGYLAFIWIWAKFGLFWAIAAAPLMIWIGLSAYGAAALTHDEFMKKYPPNKYRKD